MHDEIHEAVLFEKFSALKALGEFDFDGVPNRALPREAHQGLGFGNDEIAEHGE